MSAPASTQILNDAQLAALDLQRDLLVSAGAGAGKTQVLGLRYLAILEEGLATVPEIVAFTFTEKAAAEMRDRVQKLLLARIDELVDTDKDRHARLRRAQAEFARNRISTVHGFCHQLLKGYAWEAGLEPHAPILEERAQALARENAIKRVLLQTNAEDHPELAERLVRLGSVERLYSLMATLSAILRDRAFMKPPLTRAAELWQDPDAEIARRVERWKTLVEAAAEATFEEGARIDYATAAGVKEDDKLRQVVLPIRDAIEKRNVSELRDLLLTKSFDAAKMGNKGSQKNWGGKEGIAAMRSQVEALAQTFEPVGEFLQGEVDPEFERRVGQVVQDLAVVFDAVCDAYQEELRGGLDFLELELRTLDLLREDEAVRAQVVRKAKHLLVDEYQDTNPTQAELFELLTGGDDTPGRFFAVGDAKQSIYAFRGSDVRVFNHALDWIPRRNEKTGVANEPQQLPWGLTCEDTPERRQGVVRLEHNYRTVQALLETGNAVFREIFARDEWRDFDARPQDMIFGSDKQADGAALEFHLLAEKRRSRDTEDDERRSDDEAELVAQRVRHMHDVEKIPLTDITILVRQRTRNRQYRNAFARHNIPLLVVGEGGLFETQEALDCINLLRVLANPADDIAMLGVLRSPMAGLSDTYLTRLALEGDSFRPLLMRVEEDGSRPDEATQFLSSFRNLAERAGRDAPALLLTEALSAFAYPLAVGCGADAEQRLANVRRMVELVREMQHELPSLAPLVRELRDRIDREEDETQGVPDRSADGVRMMTVHKAKGLEFPVVILPELGSDSRGRDSGMVRNLPSREGEPLGLHLKRLDEEDGGKHRGDPRPDFAAWQAKLDRKERDAAEEKRGLYVAWTRAEKRLVLTGTVSRDKPFDRENRAHQLLRALGASAWDEGPEFIQWHEGVDRVEPQAHIESIARVRTALDTKRLPQPAEIDTSLVAPVGEATERISFVDPVAVEFGSLVHNELERRLRLPGVEAMGTLDAEAMRHVKRAADALATLPQAEIQLPEFEFMTPDGTRRIDLLRVLNGDEYQIVDYKTDAVDEDLGDHAEAQHGEQLRSYAAVLKDYLDARGRAPKKIHLLVCFTAPDGLQAAQRLVEIRS